MAASLSATPSNTLNLCRENAAHTALCHPDWSETKRAEWRDLLFGGSCMLTGWFVMQHTSDWAWRSRSLGDLNPPSQLASVQFRVV